MFAMYLSVLGSLSYCIAVLLARNQMQTVWPGTHCTRSVYVYEANTAWCTAEFVLCTVGHCAGAVEHYKIASKHSVYTTHAVV